MYPYSLSFDDKSDIGYEEEELKSVSKQDLSGHDHAAPDGGHPPGDRHSPPGHGLRPPPEHGGRPPGQGHRPPEHGHRPPGHGGRPPEHSHRPPGHGHRPPGHGHRPPEHGHRPHPPGQPFEPWSRPGSFPPGKPPVRIPERPTLTRGSTVFTIDPGALTGCLNRYTYVWLQNGTSFWMYLTFIGRQSVSGFRWTQFGWTFTGLSLQSIEMFAC